LIPISKEKNGKEGEMDIFEIEYPGMVHEYDLKDSENSYKVLVRCSEEEIRAGKDGILAIFLNKTDAMRCVWMVLKHNILRRPQIVRQEEVFFWSFYDF